MDNPLTILCITKLPPHAVRFLLEMELLADQCGAAFMIGADGLSAWTRVTHCGFKAVIILVYSNGSQESVLDEMLTHCTRDYVLRLDDDERCSQKTIRWLLEKEYLSADQWFFPRAWLWGDERHYLTNPPFWPDYQTRLSVRSKSGGLRGLHAQSPFGMGLATPCAIEHHKLLVQTRAQREAQVAYYEAMQIGAGLPVFYLPEDRPMTVEVWNDRR